MKEITFDDFCKKLVNDYLKLNLDENGEN